jgi:RNA polymerase sigma-70 factor (ECF subfamily)
MIPGSGEGTSLAWEAGRQAWPAVALQRSVFAGYLRERFAEEPVPLARAADLYLACACVEEESGALAAFETRFVSRVPAYVSRIEKSRTFTDEVRQALRQHVLLRRPGTLPRIAESIGVAVLSRVGCARWWSTSP